MIILVSNPLIFVPIGLLLVLAIWAVGTYNSIIRHKNHLRDSWSNIDVELKRRYELIPNLVATVKGYTQHESLLLQRLVELRQAAVSNRGTASSQAQDETPMLLALRQVFVHAEGYPELKSDRNFLELQRELALTEDRIAAARRFYNANVRDLISLKEQFPSSLIANRMRLERPTFFELSSEAERVVPRMGLIDGTSP
jgi:LemA protein